MTPRCVNCLHWDEDMADTDGRARCAIPRNVEEANNTKVYIYVTGDYGCRLFEPKRVTPAPVST